MLRPEQRSELQRRKILQSNGDVGRWEREGREARGGEGRRRGRGGEGSKGRRGQEEREGRGGKEGSDGESKQHITLCHLTAGL